MANYDDDYDINDALQDALQDAIDDGEGKLYLAYVRRHLAKVGLAIVPLLARPAQPLDAESETDVREAELRQARTDIQLLISSLRMLEEATGETFDDEGGAVAQIEADYKDEPTALRTRPAQPLDAEVGEVLEFYANPFKQDDEEGELIPVPDFYSELDFGDRARALLDRLKGG